MPFLLAVLLSVVIGAANIAIVAIPKTEKPPGVYSFVTGLPKADRLASSKDGTQLASQSR